MQELECYDTNELEKELERRKREKEKADKPQSVSNPDWSVVGAMCREHIEDIYARRPEGDMKHYIYEAAMEAVFGHNVWERINKMLR